MLLNCSVGEDSWESLGLQRKLSTEELMLLNCSVGEDSSESLGCKVRSTQSILKEISPGCSLVGLILKLKLQYFGHLMWRVDSFEKTLMLRNIKGSGERDDTGWDDWMASPTQWTWVWMDSGSWWWTGRPGVLRFTGMQRAGHDWATEMNWTELMIKEEILLNCSAREDCDVGESLAQQGDQTSQF